MPLNFFKERSGPPATITWLTVVVCLEGLIGDFCRLCKMLNIRCGGTLI